MSDTDDTPIGDGFQDGIAANDRPESQRRAEAVAVALKYLPESDFAPKIVAGGRGSVAEQILAIAFAQGVKVREDSDLAEMLSAINVDSEIPIEAFAAVAEILTYVYRANGDMPDFMRPEGPPGETTGTGPEEQDT